MRKMKKTSTIVMALLLATGLLAGCSAGGDADGSTTPSVVEGVAEPGYDSSFTGDKAVSPEMGSSDVITEDSEFEEDRAVISKGNLSLIAENPTEIASNIRKEVVTVGGRIDEQEEVPGNKYENASARLTVRIPSEKLEATVETIRNFGTVDSYTISSVDVTDQLTDYKVREEVLRGSIERLLTLMATATDTNTLLSIETTLSQREAELESLLAAQANLKDQVAFSTLVVYVQAPADAVSPEPDGFLDGLFAGWDGLLATLTGLTIAVGFLIPWLGVLGVIGLVVWIIFKARKKRRKTSADPIVKQSEVKGTDITLPAEEKPQQEEKP